MSSQHGRLRTSDCRKCCAVESITWWNTFLLSIKWSRSGAFFIVVLGESGIRKFGSAMNWAVAPTPPNIVGAGCLFSIGNGVGRTVIRMIDNWMWRGKKWALETLTEKRQVEKPDGRFIYLMCEARSIHNEVKSNVRQNIAWSGVPYGGYIEHTKSVLPIGWKDRLRLRLRLRPSTVGKQTEKWKFKRDFSAIIHFDKFEKRIAYRRCVFIAHTLSSFVLPRFSPIFLPLSLSIPLFLSSFIWHFPSIGMRKKKRQKNRGKFEFHVWAQINQDRYHGNWFQQANKFGCRVTD